MTNLKKVLTLNAVSSGATGILLIILNQFLANLFNTPHTWAFTEVGIFLVVFATLVFIPSFQNPPNRSLVRLIIWLDSLWVITSVIIVVFGLFQLSTIGNVLIIGVAAWVGLMAFLQNKFSLITF
jgi:hypothetical protein